VKQGTVTSPFGAVAIRGDGVLETLHEVLRAAYRSIDGRAGLVKNLSLTEKEFLTQIFANIDTTGTALEKNYPPKPVPPPGERRP